MAKKKDGFHQELEQALKDFHNPTKLGEKSPLAAPYFLGEYLLEQKIDATRAEERGRVLRSVLRDSIEKVAQKEQPRHYYSTLLRLTYIMPERLKADEIGRRLGVSRAQYFRDKPKAIQQLSLTLFHRLKPALRLELPQPQQDLVGRGEVMSSCLAALQEDQSVGLIGPGGIGKTTLAAHIAERVAQPVFWFTFRLGLNDHLDNLLFALGYFLARQGPSSLWSQLVANQTSLNIDMALALVRYDLEGLPSVLLCFDEVDLLRPAEFEGHATLLAFLESLKGLSPQLFIGQQLPLEVQQRHQLRGLSMPSLNIIFKRAKIELSMKEIERLQRYTQGNPRLLELLITLHCSNEGADTPFGSASHLAKLPTVPSLEFLLRRIWLRLSADEQNMLAQLVPFRSPAPRDVWNEKTQSAALRQLIERRLLQEPRPGQVILLPAFRGVVYKWLSAEARQTVHLDAAIIREKRAEYTEAAYHFLQAGEAKIAFDLWHSHREKEINQGQAGRALSLFDGMPLDQLSKKDQKRLALLRAQLLKITGEYERTGQILKSIKWEEDALKGLAERLKGDIAELTGKLEEATEAYLDGLHTTEKLLSEKAQFHKNLGWVSKLQGELDEAWREALLADYEAENLKGYVQERKGNYEEARIYYEKALELAQQVGYQYGQAKTCNNLGRLLINQRELDLAEAYLKKAADSFKRRGQLSSVASVNVNLALLQTKSKRHRAAIASASEALDLFEKLGEPWGQDAARLQLAKAYLGVGDLHNAETAALQLIHKKGWEGRLALWVLGDVRLAQMQYDKAIDSLQQAIALCQEHHDRYLEARALRSLAKVRRASGHEEEAQITFDHAIKLFEQLNMPQEIAETRQEQIFKQPMQFEYAH